MGKTVFHGARKGCCRPEGVTRREPIEEALGTGGMGACRPMREPGARFRRCNVIALTNAFLSANKRYALGVELFTVDRTTDNTGGHRGDFATRTHCRAVMLITRPVTLVAVAVPVSHSPFPCQMSFVSDKRHFTLKPEPVSSIICQNRRRT